MAKSSENMKQFVKWVVEKNEKSVGKMRKFTKIMIPYKAYLRATWEWESVTNPWAQLSHVKAHYMTHSPK